jgi:hypothetical protein
MFRAVILAVILVIKHRYGILFTFYLPIQFVTLFLIFRRLRSLPLFRRTIGCETMSRLDLFSRFFHLLPDRSHSVEYAALPLQAFRLLQRDAF